MPHITADDCPNLVASVAASQFDDDGNFLDAWWMFFAGVRVRTQIMVN